MCYRNSRNADDNRDLMFRTVFDDIHQLGLLLKIDRECV